MDSLARKIERTKKKVDSIQQVAEKGTQSLRQKIARATSEKELRKLAEENCIDVARMDKLGQKLAVFEPHKIGKISFQLLQEKIYILELISITIKT